MVKNILWLLLGSGVLCGLVGLWFAIYYWLNPRVEEPDGEACVTGQCGDTMEIRLKFRGNRVVETSQWTDGCTHSRSCLRAAVNLAMGKRPDEILEIDENLIQDSVGGLPKDQMHCAILAEETLRTAVEHYMLKQRTRPTPCTSS